MRMRGKKPIFGYNDTYNLDSTLAPIIAEGLKKFKEVLIDHPFAGYPSAMEMEKDFTLEDVGVSEQAINLEKDNAYFQLWLNLLDEMIFAFDSEEPEMPDGVFGEGFKVIDEAKYEAHDKEVRAYYARIKQGREYFAKYYDALWW